MSFMFATYAKIVKNIQNDKITPSFLHIYPFL